MFISYLYSFAHINGMIFYTAYKTSAQTIFLNSGEEFSKHNDAIFEIKFCFKSNQI